MSSEGGNAGPAPLVVAVTGHRNLVDEEVPRIVESIRLVFEELANKFPHTPITLLSPLAEGGGRLAARVAVEMGLKLLIPLPLPVDLYKEDFEDAASVEEFDWFCRHGTIIDLPLFEGNTLDNIAVDGPCRDNQYAQLGIFMSSHSQILLALWDGKPSRGLGGTAQVVDFHLTDVMQGMTIVEATTQQLLGRDENDLVHHIVCSRAQPDGSPADPMRPQETFWLTPDPEQPMTRSLTDSNERVFARMDEFNADAQSHQEAISKHDCDLMNPNVVARACDEKINSLFRTSDWLANYFQRRVRAMLLSTYTLAAGMGLAFIAYADLTSQEHMLYVFLLLFGIGVVIHVIAQRGQWHRKYLDYRALAEGLRVQFYWQLAGVVKVDEVRFAHDSFLQKQDIELGWIRNVMRAASIPCETSQAPADGLDVAISDWLDGPTTGQLSYYRDKAFEREKLSLITHRIGMVCLWCGIGIAVILALFHNVLSSDARNPLVVLMGVLPLIAGIREAYAHKKAEKELVKQYRFMEKIFSNARRQLDTAKSDLERRAILKALGDAALGEHAEWILMHRERPLEQSKL